MELLKMLSASEVFAQILSFFLLLFLLRKFAWKKILGLLDQRKEKITSDFKEIENNKYYSKGQHRGNTGEGQLHLNQANIKEFEKYEVEPKDLLEKIIKAYKRQKKLIEK